MTTRAVVFSPEARRDLLDLYQTIASAASRAVALSSIERLEGFYLRFDLAPSVSSDATTSGQGCRVVARSRALAAPGATGLQGVGSSRSAFEATSPEADLQQSALATARRDPMNKDASIATIEDRLASMGFLEGYAGQRAAERISSNALSEKSATGRGMCLRA